MPHETDSSAAAAGGEDGGAAAMDTEPAAGSAEEEAVATAEKTGESAASTAPAVVETRTKGGRGRGGGGGGGRSTSPVPQVDAVTQASLGQASQLMSGWYYHGLASLLTSHLQMPPGGGGGGKGTAPSSSSAAASAAAAAASLAPAAEGGGELKSEASSAVGAVAASSTTTAAAATTSGSSAPSDDLIPSPAAVNAVASKYVSENPPWVHWSKTDMAPQLKAPFDGTYRTVLSQQQLRGYRMARASHGVSKGCYYYECVLLNGPPARDILAQLPSNARLGSGLQEQLSRRVAWERDQQQAEQEEKQQGGDGDDKDSAGDSSSPEAARVGRKRKHDEAGGSSAQSKPPPRVGGHVRVGWSMRTGDLQAPVGYDKWSYAIRDIGGSLVHKSERQDHWGGVNFEPGDVIGCSIALYDDSKDEEAKSKNHIRFFKNGECLGHFIVTKGKRGGGEAFIGLENGIYYPAVSSYMGGSVQVNFGPHWIYPPRKLPPALKFQPLCDLCPPPLKPDEAEQKAAPAIKLFRKPEHQNALRLAVREEAQVLCDAYDKYWSFHVNQLREARTERGLSVQDLLDVAPPKEEPSSGTADAAEETK